MNNSINMHNGHQPADLTGVIDQFFYKPLDRWYDDARWGFRQIGQPDQLPINIRQQENQYEIQLAAPGRSRDSFNIRLEGKILTVSLKPKTQESPESSSGEKWITREFQLPAFTRSFTVDDRIDTGAINARYLDGILHVYLPLKEQARPVNRQINIE